MLANTEADRLVALGVAEVDTGAEIVVPLGLADADTKADRLVALVVKDAETEGESAVELIVTETEADVIRDVDNNVIEVPLLPLWVKRLCEAFVETVGDTDCDDIEFIDPEAETDKEMPMEVGDIIDAVWDEPLVLPTEVCNPL